MAHLGYRLLKVRSNFQLRYAKRVVKQNAYHNSIAGNSCECNMWQPWRRLAGSKKETECVLAFSRDTGGKALLGNCRGGHLLLLIVHLVPFLVHKGFSGWRMYHTIAVW